jgi:hypothetical protein
VTVVTATSAVGAETMGVDCPGSGLALGGGASTTDTSPGNGWLSSVPLEAGSTTDIAETGDDPTGWFARYEDISGGGGGGTITVYAICTP